MLPSFELKPQTLGHQNSGLSLSIGPQAVCAPGYDYVLDIGMLLGLFGTSAKTSLGDIF